MKLKNKKTGEIISSKELFTDEYINDLFSKDLNYFLSKLDKLQEYWEEYEPPKDFRPEHLKRMGVSICRGCEE